MEEKLRPLSVVATEIRRTWPHVHYTAEPYLAAMEQLETVWENFFADSGRSVVRYFLSNASTWRGPDARRLKAELQGLLAQKGA